MEKGLIKLGNSENDIPEHFHELFAAVLMLIQMFIRLPKGSLKENDLKEFLKELRFGVLFSSKFKKKIKQIDVTDSKMIVLTILPKSC